MKGWYLILALGLWACSNDSATPKERMPDDHTETTNDTINRRVRPDTPRATQAPLLQDRYANERFQDVRVQPLGKNRYRVTGKAQIFEARFGWVVEDGHHQLAKGFESTDAGAPAWGNFSFTVQVPDAAPNTTPHLVLFDSSPKDGSRQYELPIPLS